MSNCGTCKHWVEPTGWFGGGDLSVPYDPQATEEQRAERHEQQEALNARFRPCTKIDMPDYGADTHPDDPPLAYTMDGSYYRADLMTRAEFGCVLWEAQEQP